jgi:hypothetical protein
VFTILFMKFYHFLKLIFNRSVTLQAPFSFSLYSLWVYFIRVNSGFTETFSTWIKVCMFKYHKYQFTPFLIITNVFNLIYYCIPNVLIDAYKFPFACFCKALFNQTCSLTWSAKTFLTLLHSNLLCNATMQTFN